MKLNKLIKTLSLLLVVAFTSCGDFEDTIIESPAKSAGNLGVFFSESNAPIFELEPTDQTQIAVKVSRKNTSGEASVPIVVKTNDEDVFKVPATANFAAGAEEAEILVTFPDAKEGTTYKLTLALEGDEYVDPYGSGNVAYSTSVTRIKWTKIDEPFIYVDGTFTAAYGVETLPMYVEAEKAEVAGAIRYRLINPYKVPTGEWVSDDEYEAHPDAEGIFDGYPYNFPEDFDDSKDYNIVIEVKIAKEGDEEGPATMFGSKTGSIWGYGMISIGSVKGKAGVLKNGKITFAPDALYFSMADYQSGSPLPPSAPTLIYLTKEAYIKDNMHIKDFNDVETTAIEGGLSEFESVAYNKTWAKTLSKAVDIDKENPNSEYKNLYYLSDLYAKGLGLAFYYDAEKDKVSIPGSQKIGTKAFGKDVYVSQSEKIESSVKTNYKGVTIYTFGLTFHYKDGTVLGDFAETFFYKKNALKYEKADFIKKFNLLGAKTPSGVTITESEGDELKVAGKFGVAKEFTAVFNATDMTMTIPAQLLDDFNTKDEETGEDVSYYAKLLSIVGGAPSVEDLVFSFNSRGDLVVDESSAAQGFAVMIENKEDENDAGFVYINGSPMFVVTDAATAAVNAQAYENMAAVAKLANESGSNFSVQGRRTLSKK